MGLGAASSCIDAGANFAIPAGITTDLDGLPRIADGNADRASTVDMGAYELFADCNANGHADADDIDSGTSLDADADGVPDECQVAVSTMRSYKTHGTRGNFHIDLEMNPCNPVACEPRPGGVTWIEVGFTRPIDPASFSGAGGHGPGWLWLCNDANAVYVPAEATLDATGTKATFKSFLLNGQPPPDDERYEFTVSPELRGLNGQSLAGDHSGEMLVYAKDVNCDGERDQADRDAVCALLCQGLPCGDPSCTSPYPSLYVTQLNARFDLVMSPLLYAGLIGVQEINAVGSGTATYTLNRSDGACCDFEADVRTDSDNDGDIDGDDDAIEEDPPGRVFAVNSDDDNYNGIADMEETGVAGEDDLAEIQLSTTCPPMDPDSLTWSLSWDNATPPILQIWENPEKTSCNFGGPIQNGMEYPWPPPATLWVEALKTFEPVEISLRIVGFAVTSATSDNVTVKAPCQRGYWYAQVDKRSDSQESYGCKARIRTRGVTLCGDPNNRFHAGSHAFVSILARAAVPSPCAAYPGTVWAQTGYGVDRWKPDFSRHYFRYAEVAAVPLCIAGPDDYFLIVGPGPDAGNPTYEVFFDPTIGRFSFFFEDFPVAWTSIDHPDWFFRPMTHYSYVAEIHNYEDQMVGTYSERCDFQECEYRRTFYGPNLGYVPTSLTISDAITDNSDEWGIHLLSPTSFEVWDHHPIP